tara:strand:+ start:254 stop:619 length:366 start_codon:yes stop_codon:yes gene_type:complete
MRNKKKDLIKTICFDIDNVICRTKGKDYKNAKPNKIAIKKINKLFQQDYVIKLYTARFMGRNNDNILKAKKQGFKMTENQLKLWKIKYHKLVFGKTSFDLFIDDKSMYFKKKWYVDIDSYL